MISIIGLSVIIVGWIAQAFKLSAKKDKSISPIFLSLYAIGCAMLAASNFLNKDAAKGTLNLILVILPLTVLLTIKRS